MLVKTSACWVWRPTKPNSASINLKKHNYIDARDRSKHMTGNIAYLSYFKEFDGGYVTFRGGAHGGRISSKGTLKTDSLDFEDVYFVNELKFNLFSVSQMCDKKNYVLFTDTKCLVLSPNFKLPDESQILLKIPRKDNMYNFDMKNIVPKESLTCLLVKDNLVRGLPTKHFENDQTCVACLKGKQHRASCKSKVLNPITKPLFMLHMDLFGPTFVSSLMHKKYCLVVTDDYSRFTWVFFLTTKDETSEILKNFIKEIENLVDKKVKIIRCDNGTEFKNKVMDDFCREKGIRREYSIARTPQQNGVAERRNMTIIEAARTMLADSKLPTIIWAEAVSTACYVQNRVLVVKHHNKTPYELFRGFKLCLSFMRPFGCHVTILNTLDSLGKFNGKSDEDFFVGYSLSNHNLWDIIVNGDLKDEATPSGEQSSPPVPKTAKQLAARRKQERIKSILLLAIPDEYLLKFHNVLDAKSLSQIALIMRNKPDINEIDIDDLYNNLRVYEDEMKKSSTFSSNTQNSAFLSSENTNSTNEVSTASGDFGISTAGGINQVPSTPSAHDIAYSFLAHPTTNPQLENEDFQQMDGDDLEELDLRWQVAMLTVRVKKNNAQTTESSSQALVAQDGLEAMTGAMILKLNQSTML
ncbi:putative ribonuclease H-like domain-containing protein [Tanacetum coccineum]